MDLLVQKPQFNLVAFGLGKAVRVEDISYMKSRKMEYKSPLKDLKTDGLVSDFSPLELRVTYWDSKESRISQVTIPVDLVAEGLIEIKTMEVEK